MMADRLDYRPNKPGNHDILKGFVLALFIHGFLFFAGGKYFVKPVQYSVQSAIGSIDVDLVTSELQSDTDAVKSVTSTIKQQQETVKLPQPEVDVAKPVTPTTERQQEFVRIMPQEEQVTQPQLNVDMVEPITPTAEKQQQEIIKPTPPDTDVAKSIASTAEKHQETVKTIPQSSQGTIMTKSKPGYFQNQPPEYPQRARQMHQEGLVILRVEVDQEGMPEKVDVEQSSGYQLLDQAALKAVRHWRFQPERIGDLPIKSKVSIPVRFHLEEPGNESNKLNSKKDRE